MTAITTTKLAVQDFGSLDEATRRGIYQAANEDNNVDLVREFNEL